MSACPIRHIVEEAVRRLTAAEDPALVTHLTAFLTGVSSTATTAAAEGNGNHGDDQPAETVGDEDVSSAAAVLRGIGPDAALLSCGFTPVALVAESASSGGSRFDHPCFFSSASRGLGGGDPNSRRGGGGARVRRGGGVEEGVGGDTSDAASSHGGDGGGSGGGDMLSFASAFGTIVNTSSDADIGKFSSFVMSLVREKVGHFAAIVAQAERADQLLWEASAASAGLITTAATAIPPFSSDAAVLSADGHAAALTLLQQQAEAQQQRLRLQQQLQTRSSRGLALRARKEAPILIICRCADGASGGGGSAAQQRSSAGGGAGAAAAAVRKIALEMAQTVTRIVLAAEAAAAAGKAASFAAVGDEGCCPLVSVLIVAAGDCTAIPLMGSMIRAHCLGSILKPFTDSGAAVERERERERQRQLQIAAAAAAAASSATSASNPPPSADSIFSAEFLGGGGGGGSTKGGAAMSGGGDGGSGGLIPLPVARLLYDVLPHVPVVLCPAGLQRLLGAWYASLRLADVGAAFVAMVAPFRHLRRFVGAEMAEGVFSLFGDADEGERDGAGEEEADDVAAPNNASSGSSDDDNADANGGVNEGRTVGKKAPPKGRSQKKSRKQQQNSSGGRRPNSGAEAAAASQQPNVAYAKTRAEQFTANIELLQFLFDHCTVVEALSSSSSSGGSSSSSSFLQGPAAFPAATAFGALYGLVCMGDWAGLSRATLWTIVTVADMEEAGDGGGQQEQRLTSSNQLSPSATKTFDRVSGRAVAQHFAPLVRYVDISHISAVAAAFPSYFPLLSAPRVGYAPDLVRNLFNKVSIVLGAEGGTAPTNASASEAAAASPSAAVVPTSSAGFAAASGVLADANKVLDPPLPAATASSNTGLTTDGQQKQQQAPTMAFSDAFFSAAISDAVRLLYVLVCHELQAGAGSGGAVSSHAWVPLSHLCLVCCFGDELRCLRALHHLSLCRVIIMRPARGDVRSRCL